ncbi:PREDICTED: probable disease resistance protein At1g15890 [Camelina sativa]|uniref:Probable disease resistance protein At1g15890 n=1 Tax=Camelina sativa TaxID=90675 RepID=A0ABM1RJ35_CAMSA|nr:PREDICTED: probable disease resistance protein At1g15890 [Camelina sativa]
MVYCQLQLYSRRTFGLYGIGGIGKTTLLASINNFFLETVNDFEVVIWVVVSNDLQYLSIQDQILRRLNLDKDWEQDTEEERANEIHNILKGRKFMLLLDDLGSKVDLTKVGVPPITYQNGSVILFTTRSKEVCEDMEAVGIEVKRLSIAESWELFHKQLGDNTLKSHPDIPALARVVAGKCNGLPLALNVIGKTMAQKKTVQEWSHAITALNLPSEEFLLSNEGGVLPLLMVSYDSLESAKVKSCFLYCCLFPEDYEIQKNELIEYWLCEGFIDGDRDKDGANKEGLDIINLLVSSHLLMNGGVTTKVKMHGVVREMGLWIATNFGKQKEILCVKSGVWLQQIPEDIISSKVVRRMSFMNNQIAEISCSPQCPDLSTLLLQNNKLVDISGEFFRFMPAVVVLDLSENKRLIGLPEEISNLGSLQYLNLSHTGIKSLPVGLKALRKLIYLNVDYTYKLRSIVGIVMSLQNLQVLKFYNSGVCIDAILLEELQLLEHLKLLKATVDDAVSLERIQGVDRLASSIQSLCLRKMSAAVVVLNTVALRGLQRLVIRNCNILEIKIDWESKERREVLPSTSSPSFENLSSILISDLEGPRDLTWLAFAQNLVYLHVMRSSSIEEIINKEKGISIRTAHRHFVAPFRKLEYLTVTDMAELKIICGYPRAPRKLTEFTVRNCPKLPQSLRDNGERSGWIGEE